MAQKWSKPFYGSKAWQECRESYILKVHGLCERCLSNGKYIPGYIVHHKIRLRPSNINDSSITLNHDNLEYLCVECHNDEHKTAKKVKHFQFDENGEMISNRKIHIVWGSPASGKTTYVRKNMKYGDMIIDLDMISYAISMCEKGKAPSNILSTSLSIRESIYQMIKMRSIPINEVWVVAGLPKRQEREELSQRLHADLIFIDVDKDECIRRALSDSERSDKELQVDIITKWFNAYEE